MIEHLYASVRVLHILFAALWLGTAVFLTLYLSPALRSTGSQGMPVTAELLRRGMGTFIAVAAGLTVLSGLWMYWNFTNGLDMAIASHGAGLVLGIGGLCGLVAVVLGGAVIGRASKRSGELAQAVVGMANGSERDATLQSIASLQQRIAFYGRIDVILLLAALVAMCVAHNV